MGVVVRLFYGEWQADEFRPAARWRNAVSRWDTLFRIRFLFDYTTSSAPGQQNSRWPSTTIWDSSDWGRQRGFWYIFMETERERATPEWFVRLAGPTRCDKSVAPSADDRRRLQVGTAKKWIDLHMDRSIGHYAVYYCRSRVPFCQVFIIHRRLKSPRLSCPTRGRKKIKEQWAHWFRVNRKCE